MSSQAIKLLDNYLAWLKPIFVPAVIALVVLVAGGIFVDRQSQHLAEERMRANVLAQASLIRAKLEGNINGNIQLVRGLVSTISTEPDIDQTRFSALVSNLFEEQSQLRSVAAAPDLVVSMNYPLLGNDRVIGLDYRHSVLQRDSALLARDTGKLVLAGPVDLVQGGTGFVGRFPVFTEDGNDERFWGIVSAVVDANRLYADSGLLDRSLKIEISLTVRDATGGAGRRFFGPDLAHQDPVRAGVILPSGSWEIAAIPKGGWVTAHRDAWQLRLGLLVAGLLLLLPIAITGLLMGERQSHFRELKAREADLKRVSRRLGLALEASKIGVWERDLVTGLETWDERMNELYGLPADGKPRTAQQWRSAIHPDDLARAQTESDHTFEGARYETNYRLQLAQGTVRHIKSVGIRFTEPHASDRVVGVNWDVTADVTLNEDLRLAKQLTEAHNRELEAARVRIEYNALHDSLTGLPNRRYLDERLREKPLLDADGRASMALLHIDLDRFKQINDTMGHAAGDAMLIHVSEVLLANCRETDFVARVGGDEFVVLITAEEGDIYLATLAERVVTQMRLPVIYRGHECRFGVSIGIAAERGPTIDCKRLLINADIALYRAKRRGRNRFEFFSEALQAEVVNTKRVADDILSGLEREEFIAHYQPQFDAHTHDVVGVEALARWNHPTQGVRAPDFFLPIAEELNVVATIDRLILEQALADLGRWQARGLNVPRASVNVSLRRLHDEDLIKGLRQLDIAPGRISFELVESIYLDESDAIVGWNIDQIKDLGIDVEIDDFGTGYASIVSLQKLRPKRLKIDRQLVNPILVDMAQRQLLISIIDIGKSMGIEVVAEGVETMEHARILRDLGCDILQGYAFARPMGAADLEKFLCSQAWRKAS